MQLTRVEKENYDGFAPLTFGKNIEDFDVVIGAIEDETAVAIAMFNIVEEVLMRTTGAAASQVKCSTVLLR